MQLINNMYDLKYCMTKRFNISADLPNEHPCRMQLNKRSYVFVWNSNDFCTHKLTPEFYQQLKKQHDSIVMSIAKDEKIKKFKNIAIIAQMKDIIKLHSKDSEKYSITQNRNGGRTAFNIKFFSDEKNRLLVFTPRKTYYKSDVAGIPHLVELFIDTCELVVTLPFTMN